MHKLPILSAQKDIKCFATLVRMPDLHKKKGLFTQQGLLPEEKKALRLSQWDWLGDRNVTTDVGSIITGENTIVLVELKNRIDSGIISG